MTAVQDDVVVNPIPYPADMRRAVPTRSVPSREEDEPVGPVLAGTYLTAGEGWWG